MKTSKIKTVVEVKEFTNDYGVTLYHSLEMENGDKIQIGKKKPQMVGWELTYEIVEEGQHEYNKAKSVQKEDFTPQAKTSTAPTVDHLKGIKIGHALNNSIQIIGFRQEEFSKENIKMWATTILECADELNAQ